MNSDGRVLRLLELTRLSDEPRDAPAIARSVTEQVATHFLNHRAPIYRYLRYGWRCPDAEELTQEAFLRLYRALDRGDHIQDVPRWLYTVARNLAIDRGRSRHVMYLRPVMAKVWRQLSETVPDQRPTSETLLIGESRKGELLEAMGSLSSTQRQCLHLRAEGLLYRQIAETLNMSVSGVADAVARAVAKLRAKLEDHAN